MRILITKNGEIEFKVTEPSRHNKKTAKRNSSLNSSRSSFTNRSEWNKNDISFLSKTNTQFPFVKSSYVDINESKITNDILDQATKVTLKKPQIMLDKNQRKNIIKLYEGRPNMINSRNGKGLLVSNILKSFSNGLHNQSTIQLKKILSEKAIRSIKNKIMTEEEAIIKQKKQSEEEFRTVYKQWNNKVDEFEHMLTKEIKTDKNDLINYFGQKSDMSIVSFSHLCSSNNDQVIKMNKICQIMLVNQEEREKEADRIRDKLNRKKHNLKMSSRRSVDNLHSELDQTKCILDKYSNQMNYKNQYKVLLDDFRRSNWEKENVSRFTRKISNKETLPNEANNTNVKRYLLVNGNTKLLI